MANHRSALKRMRQNIEKRQRNRSYKTRVRNAVKKYLDAIETKDETAQTLLREASSLLQKGVTKGVYHKNTASRTIARLSTKLTAS
ncbi:30S ribosomal protein S20 [Thermodesulfobacteriota bacterium]